MLRKLWSPLAPVMLLAALMFANATHGQELNLTDGTATFRYDSSNAAGGNADLTSTVSNDILFQETWFFRYTDPFAGATTVELADGVSSSTGNVGTLTYEDIGAGFGGGGFDIVLTYEVNDDAGMPTLVYSAEVTNTNGTSEDVILYNYFDHDMAGAGGDSATLTIGSEPGKDRLDISDAGGLSTYRLFDSVTHYQIAEWSADLDTDIRDGTIVDLDDSGNPFGPGDFTAALQWNMTIASGGTGTVGASAGTGASAIPEPASAVVLIGLSLIGVARRRRRK